MVLSFWALYFLDMWSAKIFCKKLALIRGTIILVKRSVTDVLRTQSRFVKCVRGDAAVRTPCTLLLVRSTSVTDLKTNLSRWQPLFSRLQAFSMDSRYRFLTLGIPWTQSMTSHDVNAATRVADHEASLRRDNCLKYL